VTPERLLAALHQAWSPASSRHWRPDNPALGQCDVTALVVQDWLGGEAFAGTLPGQYPALAARLLQALAAAAVPIPA
jgi:hypothetical protein